MLLRINKSKILMISLIILFFNTFLFSNTNASSIFTKSEEEYISKNQNIKVGMLSNFKPFSFLNDENKHQGFTLDLIKEISKISKLNFEIQTNKWNIILDKFKNKELDIITGISYTEDRKKFTLFTKAYYKIPIYIFGLKNNYQYSSIDDLKEKKIGISKSLYYKDQLIKKGIRIIEFDSSNEKVKALAIGDIDYFLASFTSGKKAINSNSITNIKAIAEFHAVKKEDLRFGVKKEERILKSIIEKSLAKISSNKINSLRNKWILKLEEFQKELIPLNQKEKEYLSKKRVIYLCVNPKWMPFEKIDENSKHIGLASDYFQYFQKKIEIPIKLINTISWSQSLALIKNKKCDILSLAMKTPKRLEYMKFTKPYFIAPLVLITKKNTPFIDEIKKLGNNKIGIIKGFAFVELFKLKYPSLDIIEVKDTKMGLEKVNNSEILGFIDSLSTIAYKHQDHFIDELKINGKFDEKWKLSVAIRNDEPELLSIFNKLIDSVTSAQKQEIYNKYISINYKETFDYKTFIKIAIVILIIFIFLIYRQYIKEKNHEKIKDAYKQLETILDTTLEAIIISKEGKIKEFNKEALSLFKYNSIKDVLGKNLIDFIKSDSKVEDNTKSHELILKRSDNTVFFALSRSKDIKTKEGLIKITSIVDLTILKEKEAILIEQSKMISTGEMLQNISHQWRQPLSHISTIATGTKLQKEFNTLDDETLIANMEKINNSAQYLSQTINDFRNFFKPNIDKNVEFRVSDTLKKLNSLTKDTIENHNIHLVLEIEDCVLNQTENLLIQVLLNIINNAKDAIIENRKDKMAFIIINSKKVENNLIISVKDSGGGIDEKILNKIFDLYFTTKHESIGTGIGLYMTYQIVTKQLNGEIFAKTVSYKYKDLDLYGAMFQISIPIK